MSSLKKLQKLASFVGEEDLTQLSRKELNEAMSEIMDFLTKVNESNRGEFSKVSGQLGSDLREIRASLAQDVERYKGDLSQTAGIKIIEGFRSRLESIEDSIQARLAELKDGKDGISPELEDVIKELIPYIPKGSPDTGVEIRNKLEHLEGDERLSVDAIAGLDEKIKKAKTPSGGAIVAQRLDQIGDVDMVTTPPTDGQVLAYDATNTKWVPSSAGAGTGDVTKVGIPVDNQIGVWTGNGTIEGDAAFTFDTATDTLTIGASGNLNFGAVTVIDDNAGTTTLQNIDAIDATTEATIEAAIDTLANLTTVQGQTLTFSGSLSVESASTVNQDLTTDASPQFTAINLGHASDTTITRTGAGAIAVEGAAVLLASGALGTPASGTLTNCSGLPLSGVVDSTSEALGVGTLEVGHASDTTISRSAAGKIAVEGVDVLTVAGGTLTGNLVLGENTSIDLDPAGSADGKYSGIAITGTAGAALAFGDLVYLSAADSRWELTDADASATGGPVLIGMCVLAAAGDASATKILLQGQIRADAKFPALTIGAPVYLGETAGAIQTAIPTGADNVIRVVGFALTADEIYFNPSQDHQLSVA